MKMLARCVVTGMGSIESLVLGFFGLEWSLFDWFEWMVSRYGVFWLGTGQYPFQCHCCVGVLCEIGYLPWCAGVGGRCLGSHRCLTQYLCSALPAGGVLMDQYM